MKFWSVETPYIVGTFEGYPGGICRIPKVKIAEGEGWAYNPYVTGQIYILVVSAIVPLGNICSPREHFQY
jgi:hypothetical protein